MSVFKGAKSEYTVDCVAKFAQTGDVKFKATFRKLKRSEFTELQSAHSELDLIDPSVSDKFLDRMDQADSLRQQEKVMQVVKDALIGWDMDGEPDGDDAEDVVGDNKVPFTPENVEQAFEIIEYALALSKGFMTVQTQNINLQAKN